MIATASPTSSATFSATASTTASATDTDPGSAAYNGTAPRVIGFDDVKEGHMCERNDDDDDDEGVAMASSTSPREEGRARGPAEQG